MERCRLAKTCLSDEQRRGLCDLLHLAFLDLRGMGAPERAHRASRLAYAVHNVPLLLYAEDFSWEKIERPLQYYQAQFSDEGSRGYDYVALIAKIRQV